MPNARDLTGLRFPPNAGGPGQPAGVRVVCCAGSRGVGRNKKRVWKCECQCEKRMIFYATTGAITSGNTKSCGCWNLDPAKSGKLTHGMSQCSAKGGKASSEYSMWASIKQRCLNQNSPMYSYYGGSDPPITICDRWKDDFAAFFADVGKRPRGMELDRIDNNGPYSPENCRWASRHDQMRNTRQNVYLTLNGETKVASDWAAQYGIKISTLLARLERGWSVEKAITTPARKQDPNRSIEQTTRNIWYGMIARCHNEHEHNFQIYSKEKRTVCSAWRKHYNVFLADMGHRPSLDMSLDRINNEQGYHCGNCLECVAKGWKMNCRWATRKEQAANRRKKKSRKLPEDERPVYIPHPRVLKETALTPEVVRKAIEESTSWDAAAELLEVCSLTLRKIVKKYNGQGHKIGSPKWTHSKRYTCFGQSLTLTEWAAEKKIEFQCLFKRLEAGWPIEKALTQEVRRSKR